MTDTIKLANVRCIFPNLFKTEVYQGKDTGKYAITFLIPKSNEKAKSEIDEKIEALLKEKNKGKQLEDNRLPIKDGDKKDKDYYAGHWVIKATANAVGKNGALNEKPVAKNADGVTAEDEASCDIYSGCQVHGIISLWFYDGASGYPKRVSANLHGVKFYKHNDPIGQGNVDVDSEFDDIEMEIDDDI